ncbi:MAG: holo-ACP synthase [Thermodesulfobacteriota bacterium]|nr:holo-ACP synthase [Thermodesulfobacteriota bacterium]
MIYGVGTDIVKIARIREALTKFGTRFQERIFTPVENAYCLKKKESHLHYALRFAAKEAFAKAIGLGMRAGITWRNIEISNEASGKPTLNLYGPSAELCAKLGIKRKFVSLSHERDYGIAVVILEADGS